MALDRRGFVGALVALAAIPAIVPDRRVRLLWSTWSEMCGHVGVGRIEDGRPSGCYIGDDGKPADLPGRKWEMGLRFPDGRVAREGDWVVRRRDGSYEIRA